jgi:hypothetical protein
MEANMKIVVLMGSPNKRGSTSILVDEFSKVAKDVALERPAIIPVFCNANTLQS